MIDHPRGDVKLNLLGKDYVLVPNFKAIAAIQAATGLGMGELVNALAINDGKKLRLDVAAAVLEQAILANDQKAPSLDEIGDALIDDLSDKGNPLVTGLIKFLVPYFGKKKQVDEKKPAKAKVPTAG